MDEPSTSYGSKEAAGLATNAEEPSTSRGVELSVMGTDSAFSQMQFRNLSFGGQPLSGCAPEGSLWDCMDADSSDSSLSPAWRSQSFEPFEVEEGGTEVTFLKNQLAKKVEECEHLRQIIKELSHSRHLVAKTKVEMEEQFVELQKEYLRVAKVASLARNVSGEAMGRINRLKSELRTSQDELARTRRRYRSTAEEAAELRAENQVLRRRLELLEASRLTEDCSACAREYLYARVTLY